MTLQRPSHSHGVCGERGFGLIIRQLDFQPMMAHLTPALAAEMCLSFWKSAFACIVGFGRRESAHPSRSAARMCHCSSLSVLPRSNSYNTTLRAYTGVVDADHFPPGVCDSRRHSKIY